jgi:hypothetical protein
MKDIKSLFEDYSQSDPETIVSLILIASFIILIIWEPLSTVIDNKMINNIIYTIITISMFSGCGALGIVAIRQKEIHLFIIPIEGIGAKILGWFLALFGFGVTLWFIIIQFLKLIEITH